MTEKDITKLISEDEWMMKILRTVKTLNLLDWWIGAGFVRSKVWDYLHGYSIRTPIPDIDVIYLNSFDFSKDEKLNESTKTETQYEKVLKKINPNINWSVTNQARMHLYHQDFPYKTSEDALSHWVETATCIGVKLDELDNVILAAPKGIDDLVNLVLRPTKLSEKDIKTFYKRIEGKNWLKKWPKLKIVI